MATTTKSESKQENLLKLVRYATANADVASSKRDAAIRADIKVLQRMLGHSSTVLTLDRYGHLFPGHAESVADRLDEMAQAAGVVQRAEVVAIVRGRS